MLESETDEIDAEFHDAQVEIEGKKSFPCPNCDKICKSKGGLTKHTNAKHCDTSAELPTESDMTLENLAGIIEKIKTGLVSDDLYGTEINKFIKKFLYAFTDANSLLFNFQLKLLQLILKIFDLQPC